VEQQRQTTLLSRLRFKAVRGRCRDRADLPRLYSVGTLSDAKSRRSGRSWLAGHRRRKARAGRSVAAGRSSRPDLGRLQLGRAVEEVIRSIVASTASGSLKSAIVASAPVALLPTPMIGNSSFRAVRTSHQPSPN